MKNANFVIVVREKDGFEYLVNSFDVTSEEINFYGCEIDNYDEAEKMCWSTAMIIKKQLERQFEGIGITFTLKIIDL